MLVLTRAKNEQIVIPALGITITMLGERGGKARLGIEADRRFEIYRAEVWERICAGEPRQKAIASAPAEYGDPADPAEVSAV